MTSMTRSINAANTCERDFLTNACPTKFAHKFNFLWVTSD